MTGDEEVTCKQCSKSSQALARKRSALLFLQLNGLQFHWYNRSDLSLICIRRRRGKGRRGRRRGRRRRRRRRGKRRRRRRKRRVMKWVRNLNFYTHKHLDINPVMYMLSIIILDIIALLIYIYYNSYWYVPLQE